MNGLTLVNVGQNTTLSNGDVSQKLVQFLIVSDGELKMTGNDTGLLVVTGGIAGQFEDFGSQVLKDGSEVHGGTSTNTLSVVALSQETVDTAHWECKTRLGGSAAIELVLVQIHETYCASTVIVGPKRPQDTPCSSIGNTYD